MSKDLFFQTREREQAIQEAPVPTEYLIQYPYSREKDGNEISNRVQLPYHMAKG